MSDYSFPKGDRETHARLARGMVRRLGVDLGDRVVDGRITDDALGTLLDRCCQCSQPGACMAWEAEHTGHVEETPDYCLNRSVFETMPKNT